MTRTMIAALAAVAAFGLSACSDAADTEVNVPDVNVPSIDVPETIGPSN